MPLVALQATLQNPVKGLGRNFTSMRREGLRATGKFWHGELMPSHFTPGNESRYGQMPRNRVYMEEIKQDEGVGQGRFVKLQLKGKSLRWASAFPGITATSHQCVVRMTMPTYFERPKVGSWQDEKGRTKRITRQPDKAAELTRVSSGDKQKMQTYLVRDLDLRVQLWLRRVGP
jgi:hypothetical protein